MNIFLNIPFICFFVSGATSLIFENLWIRMLTLIFGSTTLAVSSVLTSFMGGLALGSYLLGKKADKIANPLVIYSFLEALIGIWALIMPSILKGLYPQINRVLWIHFQPEYFTFSLLRFLFTVIVVLPPATAMGGTLPLLARFIVRTEREFSQIGSRAGWLYAFNTLGAVAGIISGGFILMPAFGVSKTNLIAAASNFLLIFAPINLFRKKIEDTWTEKSHLQQVLIEPDEEMSNGGRPPLPPAILLTVLIIFGVSGFAAMNYQVVWTRVLSLIIGSSTYSFTIIVAAFLIGIATGSAIISWREQRIKNPIRFLAMTQFWIAGASAINYFLTDKYPYWFASLVTSVHNYYNHPYIVQFFMFLIAFMLTFPSTIGMGAVLPLTVKICSKGIERVGMDVGKIYSINTIGAILGSFASAFILVPLLSQVAMGYGLQWSIGLSVFFNIISCAILLGFSLKSKVIRRIASVSLPTALVVMVAITIKANLYWKAGRITVGAFRLSIADDILDEESWGEPEIAYYFDGISTTVSVERWGKHIALKNNGKVEASNGDDMPTQIMVSALPLLFHPETPGGNLSALMIGWGSGVSASTTLAFPVNSLDVVELEKRVVDASRFFKKVTGFNFDLSRFPYVSEPGLKIFVQDGRNYLSAGVKKYDIIISEPSNPWISGVANLFTTDYFKIVLRNMKKDSIFCQWVQLYEMSPRSICSIFKSFAKSFPYVMVFGSEPFSSDTLMLGSMSRFNFHIEAVAKMLKGKRVGELLKKAGIEEPFDVFSSIIFGDRDSIISRCGFAPINTDDNAFIEFSAPRDLICYEKYKESSLDLYSSERKIESLEQIISFDRTDKQKLSRQYASLALSLMKGGLDDMAGSFIVKSKRAFETNLTQLALLVMGYMKSDENEPEVQFALPTIGPRLSESAGEIFEKKYLTVVKLISDRKYNKAFEILLQLPEELWEYSGSDFQFLTAILEYHNGRYKDAIERMETILQITRDYGRQKPEIYYYLSRAYDSRFKKRKAVEHMENYVLMLLAKKLQKN